MLDDELQKPTHRKLGKDWTHCSSMHANLLIKLHQTVNTTYCAPVQVRAFMAFLLLHISPFFSFSRWPFAGWNILLRTQPLR